MKPLTKAKAEAPAPAYVPSGLLKPEISEIKNGYSPERLTEVMRATCHNEYEFALLRLVRATDRKNKAVVALAEFQRNAYPRDQKFKATLARLQQEEIEAAAEYEYSLALRDIAEEAA